MTAAPDAGKAASDAGRPSPRTDAGGPRIFVAPERGAAERAVAREIADLVRARPDAVLGLATGSTPVDVYRELVNERIAA